MDMSSSVRVVAMPELGWDSVTVPGAVSGWVALSDRYGNLPFEELFADAIHYAENGFLVGPKTAFYWRLLENRYKDFDDFNEHFYPPPCAGDIFYRPDLAVTLREIAATRGESFYRGRLASKMVDCSAGAGGCLSLGDLDKHTCDGEDGLADSTRYPNIGGQNQMYLVSRLKYFRDGKEAGNQMNAQAVLLSDEVIEKLATHFSKKSY